MKFFAFRNISGKSGCTDNIAVFVEYGRFKSFKQSFFIVDFNDFFTRDSFLCCHNMNVVIAVFFSQFLRAYIKIVFSEQFFYSQIESFCKRFIYGYKVAFFVFQPCHERQVIENCLKLVFAFQ